jgi:hypothetical protein
MQLGVFLSTVADDPEPMTYAISREQVLAIYSLLSDWRDCRATLRDVGLKPRRTT